MKPARSSRSRGFATLMAIILIGMVGVALAVMSALFAHEAKRTRQTRGEAQLRQMLLAGAASVDERLSSWQAEVPEQKWAVALPKGLADDGAAVSVQVSQQGLTLKVAIEGQLEGRNGQQTLTVVRADGRWRIAAARLGD